MKPVFEVYGTSTCDWCARALSFLIEHGEEFNYYEIDKNPSAYHAYQEHFPGKRTVPQIISPEGDKIGGFDSLVNLFK